MEKEKKSVIKNTSPKKTRKKSDNTEKNVKTKTSTNRISVKNKEFEFEIINPINVSETNGIYTFLKNSFNSRDYIRGSIFVILKNCLISFYVSYLLYVFLNTNSFSFQRLTFTDASNFGFIVFIMFLIKDVVFVCSLLLSNKMFGYMVRWRRAISCYGSGSISTSLCMILCILYYIIFKQVSIILIILAIVLNVVIMIKTVDLSSLDDENKKIYIYILSIFVSCSSIILFFPLFNKNLLRILEIIF